MSTGRLSGIATGLLAVVALVAAFAFSVNVIESMLLGVVAFRVYAIADTV